jgi:hypothetical protein
VESATGKGGRATPQAKKMEQLQKVGRTMYWRKQKGHVSRRTLNKQSLQQQMVDSRRQVSHSLRQTFTKLSPDSPLVFFPLALMRQQHWMLKD